MTENDVVLTILRDRNQRHTCMPRYTPNFWPFECDVAELTDSGYFREYEVKLTLADFKNDAKKIDRPNWRDPSVRQTKHERLASGDPKSPCQFYFVAPSGLIPHGIVPRWAGLIEVFHRDSGWKPPYHLYLREAVKSPRIHSHKADEKMRREMHRCAYYRFQSAIFDLEKALRKNPQPHPEPEPTFTDTPSVEIQPT